MVGGAKLQFKPNPIPTRHSEGSNKTCVHQDPEPPQRHTNRRIIPNIFSHCWESSRTHNRFPNLGIWQRDWEPPREFDSGGQWDLIIELTQHWGNRLLEGTNKTLCTPGPRRKEQWPHKRLSQTCPWVSRSLQQRRGSVVAGCKVGSPECGSACMYGTFWRRSPLSSLPPP